MDPNEERENTTADLDSNPSLACFANNYFIAFVLNSNGKSLPPESKYEQENNPFITYNRSLIEEEELSHNYNKSPTLKSKLLFMDYQFNTMKENTITMLETNNENKTPTSLSVPIIKLGRTNYSQNNIQVSGGNAVSRRHCVIINSKDNVWLYDLASTGTLLNDEKVHQKIPLIGFNILTINEVDFKITTDKSKLL